MATIKKRDKNSQWREFHAEKFHQLLLFDNNRYIDELPADTKERFELFTPDGLVSLQSCATKKDAEELASNCQLFKPPIPVKIIGSIQEEYTGRIGKVICKSKVFDQYLVIIENESQQPPIPIIVGWYPINLLRRLDKGVVRFFHTLIVRDFF